MANRLTIARQASATGIALHAGVPVTMTLSPATPGAGIVFRRADMDDAEVPARYDLVGETRLGTVVGADGVTVGVIEHLMAAVAGAGIDDMLVTLDGPEPPILDGDALSFLLLLDRAGTAEHDMPRDYIKILKPVTVEQGGAHAALLPADDLSYDCEIDFAAAAIGRQHYHFAFSPQGFRAEIAPARTFGFVRELQQLHALNLGRGASLENTLALDDNGVVNKERMRFADEFVRHKILDAIGDMALAGAPLIGRFQGHRSGHATNNALLRALFADPSNYRKATL